MRVPKNGTRIINKAFLDSIRTKADIWKKDYGTGRVSGDRQSKR